MKAQNPVWARPVKVLTTNGLTGKEISKIMLKNSMEGLVPQWRELPEEDTPELDTETLFTIREGLELHQTTIPFPIDEYGKVMAGKTATEVLNYCLSVCRREGWKETYPDLIAVLNQLDMEM